MKIIWHNKEIWDDPKFRRTPAWAKALYFHVYDKCDEAGFWDFDMTFAQAYLNFDEPKTVEEVEHALNGFLRRTKDELFLVPNFINQTQAGTSINPSQPPHVKVLEAMVERKRGGLVDVGDLVKEANPSLEFERTEDVEAHGENQQRALKRAVVFHHELEMYDKRYCRANGTESETAPPSQSEPEETELRANF